MQNTNDNKHEIVISGNSDKSADNLNLENNEVVEEAPNKTEIEVSETPSESISTEANNEENNSEEQVENKVEEPLFRIVLPKRRTWFYNFKYRIRSSKFFEAIFGPQVKALPAPSQFRI